MSEAPSADALIDEMISVLGSFLKSTDALTGAINSRNAVAMCDALEGLSRARERALGLIGLEPAAI